MPSKTTSTRPEPASTPEASPTSWDLREREDRPRRGVDHPGAGHTVHVPVRVWTQTLDLIRGYAPLNSERMVLWSGVVGASGELLVRSIIVPDHDPDGWLVDIGPDLWRSMLTALRRQDQILVAQVHSHPGNAYHSWGDDAFPAEHCDGFLSLVVPDFGRGVEAISDCAIFEYRLEGADGSFVELGPESIEDRFLTEHEIVRAVPNEA